MDIKKMFRKKGIPVNDPVLTKIFQIFGGDDLNIGDLYRLHPGVRAAIWAKARNVSQVPFKIYRLGSDVPLDRVPITELFNTVNRYMSKYQLWEAIVISLDVYGEAFIQEGVEVVSQVPTFLRVLNPGNVKEKIVGGQLVGWELKRERITLPEEKVIHIKYWNPYNEIRGLSPLEALQTNVGADYSAMKYNQFFFKNDATPGTVYMTDQSLTDVQFQRIQDQLINSRSGQAHAHKALLLDNGLKADRNKPNNRDMEFIALRKHTLEEIAMVFGVPKEALQVYEDINYATSIQADLSFWKKTLIPLMTMISDKVNADFLNNLGYEGRFDITAVDVLNAEILEKAQAATAYYNMGVPFEVINARLNLGFPPFEGDKKSRYEREIPAVVLDAKEPEKKKEIDVTEEKSSDELLKAMRTRKYLETAARIRPIEAATNATIKKYFAKAEKKLINRMAKKIDGQYVLKQGVINPENIARIREIVGDIISDAELLELLEPFYKRAASSAYAATTAQVGRYAKLPERIILEVVANRGEKIKEVALNANKLVQQKVQDALAASLEIGETEEQRADRVMDALKDAMNVEKNRARAIARTEIHGAYSEAQYETGRELGASKKTWLSARDGNVRSFAKGDAADHVMMDGETVNYEQTFSNGLMFPQDPNGPAAEVINCRCAYNPIFE